MLEGNYEKNRNKNVYPGMVKSLERTEHLHVYITAISVENVDISPTQTRKNLKTLSHAARFLATCFAILLLHERYRLVKII